MPKRRFRTRLVSPKPLFSPASERCRTQASLPRRMPQSGSKASLKVSGIAVAPARRRRGCAASRPRSRASRAPTGRPGSRRSAGRASSSARRSAACAAVATARSERGRPGRSACPILVGSGGAGKARFRRRAGATPSSRRCPWKPLDGRRSCAACSSPRPVAGVALAVAVACRRLAGRGLLRRRRRLARIQAAPQQLGQVDDVALPTAPRRSRSA